MLQEERERTDQMNEENMALKEQIQRLELELSNLPVGDCGMMREASVQISQLLQTLNEDMAKAPELCSRLRMAAQQVSYAAARLPSACMFLMLPVQIPILNMYCNAFSRIR